MQRDGEGHEKVRLDKWLWAARFYKTRSRASEAVDGGKVQVNGERVKPAKLVQRGDEIRLRDGPFEHLLTITGLAERRGPAAIAATLYEETPASKAGRERVAEQLRAAPAAFAFDRGRPSKKDRRDIDRYRGKKG